MERVVDESRDVHGSDFLRMYNYHFSDFPSFHLLQNLRILE